MCLWFIIAADNITCDVTNATFLLDLVSEIRVDHAGASLGSGLISEYRMV